MPPTIFQLEALRKAKQEDDARKASGRVKVEVACRESVGEFIQDRFSAAFESVGCAVVGDDKPDWMLSVIAFSAGNLVELSIVLRRLFRSTVPGTEVEHVDAEGAARLRAGGWVYESLRFHGLFGVPTAELGTFIDRTVRDFPVQQDEEKAARRRNSTVL
jgi:hypothetical protein